MMMSRLREDPENRKKMYQRFVQHEEKAQEYDIVPFLNQIQEYRRALAIMCELHVLGNPKFSMPVYTQMSGKMPKGLKSKIPDEAKGVHTSAKLAVVSDLERTRDGWKDRLSSTLEENKLLCLFSSLSAQRMAELIALQDGQSQWCAA